MSSVYTTRFVINAIGNTAAAYTVPAGQRAVVTSFTATMTSGAGGKVYLQLAGQNAAVFSFQAVDARALQLRLAAYHGETITIYVEGAGGLTGMAGGYLFADPTGARAPEVERELVARPQPLPATVA